MNQINLRIEANTRELLQKLEDMNLIKLWRPFGISLDPPPGINGDVVLYESKEEYGPHRLYCVACNMTELDLGTHDDYEDFLIPPQKGKVKPCYLVVCHLSRAEIEEKDASGTLCADDFTCFDLYAGSWETSMFTMPTNVYHAEYTPKGPGKIGCFFVTDSRDNAYLPMGVLKNTDVVIG